MVLMVNFMVYPKGSKANGIKMSNGIKRFGTATYGIPFPDGNRFGYEKRVAPMNKIIAFFSEIGLIVIHCNNIYIRRSGHPDVEHFIIGSTAGVLPECSVFGRNPCINQRRQIMDFLTGF